ncbi:MAG: hypothetical protein WAN86_04610 [Hyphomicrobiaceae bacterium]
MPDVFSHARTQEAEGRRRQMLPSGPPSRRALADPTVIEVMANPDGKLWIESVPAGRRDSGQRIGAAEAERIIRLVAAHVRREVTDQLVQEAVVTVPRALIAEAVDLIVFLAGRGTSRRVESLIEVQGLDPGGDYLLKPVAPPVLHVV